MKNFRLLSAVFMLAGLVRANSSETTERVVQLPPVVVEATRLPSPRVEISSDVKEALAAATQATQADMRHSLARSHRRLVAEQRRTPPAAAAVARKPNA